MLILADGQVRYCGEIGALKAASQSDYMVRLLVECPAFEDDGKARGVSVTHTERGVYRVVLAAQRRTGGDLVDGTVVTRGDHWSRT